MHALRKKEVFSFFSQKTVAIFLKCDKIEISQNRRYDTMAYKISDDCLACGACVEACPVEAITEGDGKYVIDADKCLSCGACDDACPVGAPQEA